MNVKIEQYEFRNTNNRKYAGGKNEQSLRKLQSYHKRSNICVIAISEKEKKLVRLKIIPLK